jgi:hypothetical protein
MEQPGVVINDLKGGEILTKANSVNAEASKISNVVLKRLIEEVQYESQNNILAYNRTHNRHNRGR